MNGALADEGKAEAAFREGLAAHREGRLAAAQELYRQVLGVRPENFQALHLLGLIELQTNDPVSALEWFQKALAINPCSAEAHNDMGSALLMSGRHEAAIASYQSAIELKGDYAEALYNRGNALLDLSRYPPAIESYDAAVSMRADYAPAYANRGLARSCLKLYKEAIVDYDKALAIQPNNAEVHCFRGDALRDLRRFQAAIVDYDKAVEQNPHFAAAYNGRGSAFAELKNSQAALGSYGQAVELKPDFYQAYSNRGNVFKELRQWQAALGNYDKAIALEPRFAEAHFNRADVSRRLRQSGAAMAGYDRAFALNPDLPFLAGQRLHASMQVCCWRTAEADIVALAAGIERGEPASPPFAVLSLTADAALQRRAAEIWVHEQCPADSSLPPLPKWDRHDRIRVGYFSPDFREHPVSSLTAELFETHDRSRFEIAAFSYGPDTQDEMRKRLQSAFDHFIDVRERSDHEIALLARRMELDIAVDLGGFTEDCRPRILALRAAPLQIGYLGYPGTMAALYMDYLIADATIVPPTHRQYYAEKILSLRSFQPNPAVRRIADKLPTRGDLGLPQTGFVFCCFNTNYKITPAMFRVWMRILDRVHGSVLWLRGDDEVAIENLRHEARASGVAAERLVFAPKLPSMEAHLARYSVADLFLDTFPYGAHTTAGDALWAGLPVLTCTGDAFASRVGASLLNAIEVPELIATTVERYEKLAIELAADLPRLTELRRRLAANRHTTALFDISGYTRDLESVYERIYDRHQAALPAEHLAGR
jgi:predicted O-linked N-acetylglucosamine transferase (SPINDLY family)